MKGGEKTMKKYIVSILLLSLIFFVPKHTFAHFLESDNNIGAVLHVEPNDNPIAGSLASFFFEFKDKTNKFDPAKCDCTVVITEAGKTIYSQPLFQNTTKPSLTNASVFYTFPKEDVYVVKVIGKPQMPGGFQPFTLTWNFRVDQQANKPAGTTSFLSQHIFHIATALIGVALLIWFFLKQEIFAKKSKQMKGGDKHAKKNNSAE